MKGWNTMHFDQETAYSPILKCFETSASKQPRPLGSQVHDAPKTPPIPNFVLPTLLVLTIVCFLTFTYHELVPF